MKVTSSKNGSSRERLEVDCDFVAVASWRPDWSAAGNGMSQSVSRSLVLSSVWGGERSYEFRLTEREAIAIAKAVCEDLFTSAQTKLFEQAAE